MQISRYSEYLVVNKKKPGYVSQVVKGNEIHSVVSKETVNISEIHTYEIYTKNPETGEGGWDIKHLRSTDTLVKKYPHFDTIITRNDCQGKIDFLDYSAVLEEDS